MAAHRYWQAMSMAAATPATLELSEFQLYNGATRVDAAATLTASAAPSGAIANLKDDNTGTGSYWATGGDLVVLTWTFASAVNVDGIVLGSRTTSARWPLSLQLLGGDYTTGTGPSPEYTERQYYAAPRFIASTKTAILRPTAPLRANTKRSQDLFISPGSGRVPYEVVREVLPRTDPKTYVPQRAKVRLERDIDGRVVCEQWSDPVTGLGAFEYIDPNFLYTVTAIYPESGMRAVIADRIKPEGYPEPTP